MEFSVIARAIDYLGLPVDHVHRSKPVAASLVRVRSTDNLRGGEDIHKKSFADGNYKVKGVCRERPDVKEGCADNRKLEPPQYLCGKDFFTLSSLICGRLSSKEIHGIGDETFLNFIDQALLDLKYLDSWVEKLIANKKKIPRLLVRSFIENMIECRSSYAILVRDLMSYKNYFENKSCKPLGEASNADSKHDGCPLKQDERCSVVYKLASSWSYLLKYMSQCNEVMPSPSLISDLDLPDIEHPLYLREPTLESIMEVKGRLEELKNCWQKLNQWLRESPDRLFVKKEEQTHYVMLRVDSQFIPGTLDIHELVVEKKTGGDRRARATVSAQWLVPKNVWSFSEKDPLAGVAGRGGHDGYTRKQPSTIKYPYSSTRAGKHGVALKPADYFLYQPVMKKLMTSICAMNIKRLSSLQDRVNFFRDESSIEPLTTNEKKLLKEFAEVLETSRIWWRTESPSVRSIFDQIFLEEINKSSLKKGVMSLVTKVRSQVKLGRSSSHKVQDKRHKEFLPVRPCSLRERDLGLIEPEPPRITFTPASPEHKPKD
ncbi:hypothetical protein [Endozoicomonas atrinae]|uniref:hypothetical protein n=1 Tax=Endozoicomonas atrinae TaxID=1333660 RepID=UPI0008267D9E|nr:hypothetical protein [Endozoicomonas atrinae]